MQVLRKPNIHHFSHRQKTATGTAWYGTITMQLSSFSYLEEMLFVVVGSLCLKFILLHQSCLFHCIFVHMIPASYPFPRSMLTRKQNGIDRSLSQRHRSLLAVPLVVSMFCLHVYSILGTMSPKFNDCNVSEITKFRFAFTPFIFHLDIFMTLIFLVVKHLHSLCLHPRHFETNEN